MVVWNKVWLVDGTSTNLTRYLYLMTARGVTLFSRKIFGKPQQFEYCIDEQHYSIK